MCLPSIALWYFTLLLVASFSESQENFTSGDEQSDNSTMYDPLAIIMEYQNNEMEPTRCNSRESFIKNDDEMQYESCINSTKNDRKSNDSMRYESREHMKNHKGNNQMFMESRTNFTEINDSLQEINENLIKIENENNFTVNNLYENFNIDSNNSIVSHEACNNVTCVQLCCPFGEKLTIKGRCDRPIAQGNYSFPSAKNDFEEFDKPFLTVHDPCVAQQFGRRLFPANEYLYLVNGSLFLGPDKLIPSTDYCFAIFLRNIYDVILCTGPEKIPIYISICLLVSLPFLLLTFVVYSILPELQNMHGYTLRAHVASLFISYSIMFVGQQVRELSENNYLCIPIAYIFNFFFLSSFFWLNVTCFDIWWTFRGLRSCRTNIKQEKKKFVTYSIYAWGIALILNIICAVIDYTPGLEKLVRPNICKNKFWYGEVYAKTLYFYVPMGITIICNICFFIATTLTILKQNLRTAHQMRNSESRCHNENKQWLNMYLKLFIVMGITWIMEILSWSVNLDFLPVSFWYPGDIINALQGLIIFIIFVCRGKIKQLLLKRFNGQSCGPFCKIPSINEPSTASNTTSTSTTSSGTVPMQEINPSNQ